MQGSVKLKTKIVKVLRFSQQCCWRLESPGMWHCHWVSTQHFKDPEGEGTMILQKVRNYSYSQHCIKSHETWVLRRKVTWEPLV